MSLEEKTLDELREIAKDLGIKVHHMAKEKSIIAQINKQQPHRVEASLQASEKTVQAANAPEATNTPEDVKEALSALKTRLPEFEVIFPDDNTWIFKFRGAEDSGNLAIPLRVIVMKANNVARGRRSMRTLGREETDSSYAGAILSV